MNPTAPATAACCCLRRETLVTFRDADSAKALRSVQIERQFKYMHMFLIAIFIGIVSAY